MKLIGMFLVGLATSALGQFCNGEFCSTTPDCPVNCICTGWNCIPREGWSDALDWEEPEWSVRRREIEQEEFEQGSFSERRVKLE
ncbi:hypothetical protein CLCR_09313 [Cladophialophora carrionii]|uniref:Uncharacterized protein n=1 Tax=Cladophialophora carrionii TaxID=86049 RepID=A0A1C1CTG1_9EURO|nr:hypothetical protein CLCR_09313 [Cladophialophora carrionii]